MPMPVDPFSLDQSSSLAGRAAALVARPLLDWIAGLRHLRAIYSSLRPGPDETFSARALEALSISVCADASEVATLPGHGPLIIAANHPRGAVDGLVLDALVRRVRPDVRLLANCLLSRIPELRSTCFFVDPFEGPHARARSLAGLRAAHLWLRRSGALIIFPAGTVAPRIDDNGDPEDSAWSHTVGRLALATGAALVPACLDGANSRRFYAAGVIHERLRTLLLPREVLETRGSRVRVSLGSAMPVAGNAATLTAAARAAVRALARVPSPRSCAVEVQELPPQATLVTAGRFQVYCAPAPDIPATLHEIGRLRAVSYRDAGEGTGAEIDLDTYDQHYLHLFVWDHARACVVGAYRIGRSDRIVADDGVAGLYTRTLFRYDRGLIEALAPALELGRSFVRPEYQRHHQALLLLWRGIGQFVVRHPEYRVLFGPVSISAHYCDASHALLTAFLEQNQLDTSLARMVDAVHPRPSTSIPMATVPHDVAGLEKLIASLEPDGKRMPVLLRQYLKLDARVLGISVDPQFGHVVDALMTVDLTRVSPAILRRYFGDEGFASYVRRHAASISPAA